MRILMLYGVNCTKEIWDNLKIYLSDYEVDYVEYPHEITQKALKVEDITKWVYEKKSYEFYDAIIGHSLGGIIALQLISEYKMKANRVICLDTNLKPAEPFYRNLMTQEHMDEYGDMILKMFDGERQFYRTELFASLQGEFDYTGYVKNIEQPVYVLYGDRGMREYPNRIRDLNLQEDVVNRLKIKFIKNACHMIMLENPSELASVLREIFTEG